MYWVQKGPQDNLKKNVGYKCHIHDFEKQYGYKHHQNLLPQWTIHGQISKLLKRAIFNFFSPTLIPAVFH